MKLKNRKDLKKLQSKFYSQQQKKLNKEQRNKSKANGAKQNGSSEEK
jgi:hypothetical protein